MAGQRVPFDGLDVFTPAICGERRHPHDAWTGPCLRSLLVGLSLAMVMAMAGLARAELAPEVPGQVETVERPFAPHNIWVADMLLRRSALIDLDEGRFLGMVNGGYGPIALLFSRARSEIYVPSTHYSRTSYGERTDVVTIYDAGSLARLGEVVIPPKRGISRIAAAHAAISDDERFIAVFNLTPATSLSIVDLERRIFTAEIQTPGCSLVYGAGARRFLSLCGDGAVLSIWVDDDGLEAGRARSRPFFDPETDPVTEKAVRHGDHWIFVSFEGLVHPVDVSGREVRVQEPWALVSESDRAESWRIGGLQHLAVHERTGRLYSLMHRGGVDTHKEAGEEVWVHDLEARSRLQRIELRNPGITFLSFPIELGDGWPWPLNQLLDWIFDTFVPAAVGQIQVTQNEEPLLVTGAEISGSLGVYDALSGDFLARIQGMGITTDVLQVPHGRGIAP